MVRRSCAIAVAAGVLAVVPVSTAVAADAQGCSGSAVSQDASGTVIGQASAPGAGATRDDPLPIDPGGRVAWKGSTPAAIRSGSWSVTVAGVPALNGTIDNPSGATSAAGVQDLSSVGPLSWVLKGGIVVPVSGRAEGSGGSCTASGYITGTGSALTSPVLWVGAVLGLIGLLMLVSTVAGTTAAVAAPATVTEASGGQS